LIFVWLYLLFPDVRDALAIVKPDTVIRWHLSLPKTISGSIDDADRGARASARPYPAE
jgi:hypothetical protein